MTFDLQNMLVWLAVAAAAIYMTYRVVKAVRLKGGACQRCRGCAAPLVTIDPPRGKDSRGSSSPSS